MVDEDEAFYAKPVTRDFGRVDELFYFNGTWILHKPVDFMAGASFGFGVAEDYRAGQAQRDMLWSMRIAPPPGNPFLITGV